MLMGTIGVVKLFVAHAKQSNILELDKNDLRENFYQFKQMEKYQELLQLYEYDEDNICHRLEFELKQLIFEKQIINYRKSVYIFGMNTEIQKSYTPKNNQLAREMVEDYIKINMQKQKVNVG